MIKLFKGEVYKINLLDTDQMNLIMQSMKQIKKDVKPYFLIYKGEQLIKAVCYQDFLAKRNVLEGKILFDENFFENAAQYFQRIGNKDHSCLPVVNEIGEYVFLLEFYEDKSYNRSKDGISYIISKEGVPDFSLFYGCEAVVFWELEEYTYKICKLLKEKYPEMTIIFLDSNATLVFKDVYICGNIYEIDRYIKGKRCIYITSRFRNEELIVPDTIINIYNSLSVMQSLFWGGKHKEYGNLNKGKTILLIDYACPQNGLVDIMLRTCGWIMLAYDRGWLPVVNLSTLPNQYLVAEGENMWEYFFMQPSNISVKEALKSYDVVSLKENNQYLGGFEVNPYLRKAYGYLMGMAGRSDYFQKMVKLNHFTEKYIKENIPYQIMDSRTRVLGVIMRGTDYREAAVRYRGMGVASNADIWSVVQKVEETEQKFVYDFIFVATEEEEYLEIFQKEFGRKVIYIDQKRVRYNTEKDYDKLVSELLNVQGDMEFTKKYLTVLYALSKCNGLLSSMICGSRFVARSWNCGKYDIDEVVT